MGAYVAFLTFVEHHLFQCLWCHTNKACLDYPVSRILPPSSLCKLSSARWGVCWGKSLFSWSSRKICAVLESLVVLSERKLPKRVLSAGSQEASERVCFLGGLLAVPGVWRPSCRTISLGSAPGPSASRDGGGQSVRLGTVSGCVGVRCLGCVCALGVLLSKVRPFFPDLSLSVCRWWVFQALSLWVC